MYLKKTYICNVLPAKTKKKTFRKLYGVKKISLQWKKCPLDQSAHLHQVELRGVNFSPEIRGEKSSTRNPTKSHNKPVVSSLQSSWIRFSSFPTARRRLLWKHRAPGQPGHHLASRYVYIYIYHGKPAFPSFMGGFISPIFCWLTTFIFVKVSKLDCIIYEL